jgi:hypothetical protein
MDKAVRFRKVLIADERYETANVFDVNNDGVLDIVSGSFWYEGPDFKKKHFIGNIMEVPECYDDFSTIPMDVNGNGYLDYVTGGWFGEVLRWQENPGPVESEWKAHEIARIGKIETTRAWDVDRDGFLEIVPNTPNDPLRVFKLVLDKNGKGTGVFESHTIWDNPQGHGLGFGDISGKGRGDFALWNGWLEAPEDPYHGEWVFHQEYELFKPASVPILVVDVNRDGINDLIVGSAHNYGLDWWEQQVRSDGSRRWVKHIIDPGNSQYHDLIWADIDGDGENELITGKRYKAHNYVDPGTNDDYGIYYFKWTGESFVKQIIDYGPRRVGKGCGIFFAVADLQKTGRLDVLAPGKDGLYVFYNEG